MTRPRTSSRKPIWTRGHLSCSRSRMPCPLWRRWRTFTPQEREDVDRRLAFNAAAVDLRTWVSRETDAPEAWLLGGRRILPGTLFPSRDGVSQVGSLIL